MLLPPATPAPAAPAAAARTVWVAAETSPYKKEVIAVVIPCGRGLRTQDHQKTSSLLLLPLRAGRRRRGRQQPRAFISLQLLLLVGDDHQPTKKPTMLPNSLL